MIEFIYCPNCGTLMTAYTTFRQCSLCGYRIPAQTVTLTTGTAKAKNVAEGKKAYTANATVLKVRNEDAIPIEWMKNYARKICTDDGGRYNSKAYGIDRMIYDWEKENETN